MKKLCCITLSLLLCWGLCGCQRESYDPQDTLPSLEAHEMETVVPDGYNIYDHLFGEIVGKLSPNILVLTMDTPRMVNTWGKTVYIITDEADKWCIGDEISVNFSIVERPLDTKQYVRIIADEVHSLNDLCAKPIIYIYPEAPTLCSAKLTLNGKLTCTYPDHGEAGWQNFTANPDGTLTFPDGKSYYALYWEGIQSAEWDFSQGFCVRGEDTAEFLEWALASQGLTEREANEFIIYWLPLMQNNPYNIISFQTDAYTDGAKLEITPTPDTIIRVFMAYSPSNVAVDIEPQTFDTPERQGFTVVEWGGSVVGE